MAVMMTISVVALLIPVVLIWKIHRDIKKKKRKADIAEIMRLHRESQPIDNGINEKSHGMEHLTFRISNLPEYHHETAIDRGPVPDWVKEYSTPVQNEHHSTDVNLIKVSSDLEFDYCNMDGDKSRRTVSVKNMEIKELGQYIWGYCYTRKDFRTFNIERIEHCVDTATGEMIIDVADYLTEQHKQQIRSYQTTEHYTLDKLKKSDPDLLSALFYVCKADGRFTAAEKTIIVELLRQLTGDNRITVEQINDLYKFETPPSKIQFEIMVRRLKKKDQNYRDLVLQSVKDIINTQKQVTDEEQAALDFMAAQFGA